MSAAAGISFWVIPSISREVERKKMWKWKWEWEWNIDKQQQQRDKRVSFVDRWWFKGLLLFQSVGFEVMVVDLGLQGREEMGGWGWDGMLCCLSLMND